MRLFFSFFLLSLVPFSTFAYTDLPEDHVAYTAVTTLSESGVIGGYAEDLFLPDRHANRVEVIKVLLTAFELFTPSCQNYTLSFWDIPREEWYTPFVTCSTKLGLTTGYADQSFRPQNVVNKAEFLRMLFTAADLRVGHIDVRTAPFLDVPEDAWYAKYVLFAKEQNILPPTLSDSFYPLSSISRGDLAYITYRTLVYKASLLE